MAVEQRIAFNAMPDTTRQRLVTFLPGVAPEGPLHAEPSGGAAGRVFAILLAVGAMFGVIGLFASDLDSAYEYQETPFIGLYAGLIFLALGGILYAVRAFWADKALPFKPGRYLTAMEFIDARTETFRLIPLKHLAGPIKIVDHYTNGVYTATAMTLPFEGGTSETFSVRGRGKAEQIVDLLNQGHRHIRAALEANDMGMLARLDPFLELRTQNFQVPASDAVPLAGPVARRVPMALRHPWLGALAVGAVLGAPVWWVREKLVHDAVVIAQLRTSTDTWDMENYIEHGGRHAEEVRTVHLPRAAYANAVSAGTVSALREFIKKYPDAKQVADARKAIHQKFEEAKQRFHAEAAENPQLVAAIDGLLDWIEKNDLPKVPVRFRAPESSLAELDAKLSNSDELDLPDGMKVVPVASHFSPDASKARESSVTNVIGKGLAAVFPTEVVELEHAGRVSEDLAGAMKEAKVAGPEIVVSYVVAPSGSLYSSQTDRTRAFIGILVNFDVTLRVPGQDKPYTITFAVKPPPTFEVRNQADDSEIYTVMAERAFDELQEKLVVAFFRPGSPAYEQAKKAIEEREAERAKPDPEPAEGGSFGGQ